MKKIIILTFLIAGCFMFSFQPNLEASSSADLGHWIDVYGGNIEPIGAVCAGSGEDCFAGDTKKYPQIPVIRV
ncbi:hypothetical protein [Belliella pelovolcani]|uniref:hypothetical protein n=1 Tax=Belliella pelovolcani TaxID=529505 RepID=UPI00391B6C2E